MQSRAPGYTNTEMPVLQVIASRYCYVSAQGPPGPDGAPGDIGPNGLQGAPGSSGSAGTKGSVVSIHMRVVKSTQQL